MKNKSNYQDKQTNTDNIKTKNQYISIDNNFKGINLILI